MLGECPSGRRYVATASSEKTTSAPYFSYRSGYRHGTYLAEKRYPSNQLTPKNSLIMTLRESSLCFQHVAPELRLFCGEDSLNALARELKRNGCRRAVIVCGRSISRSSGMAILRSTLGSALAAECNAVRSNSPVSAVEEVARFLGDHEADACIAVGGGSAAVTARAASILLAEKLPVQELSTRRLPNGEFESPRLNAPKLPQFVVPTTPSTAFVKAGSAVNMPETRQRLALFDPKTRAKALFLHPDFLRTSPSELVQSASLNTLSTAVEALESRKCDPISEAMLTHALRLIAGYLHRLSPDDVAAREHLTLAAVLCGRGTEQAGGGLASVLAHAIGHRCDVANGIVNAIVLPHTMSFNAPQTLRTAPRIIEALNYDLPPDGSSAETKPGQAAEVLDSLFAKWAIPRRLRDIGVSRSDLAAIAEAAMADWFISRNARSVSSVDEVKAILNSAW